MTRKIIKEITKEQYENAVNNHTYEGVFTLHEMCGLGIYYKDFYEKDGKYYALYVTGASCD